MRMLDGGLIVKGVNPACFGTMSEEDNKEEVKSEQSGGDIIPEHQQVVGVQHQRTQSMDDLFEQILNMPQAFHHEKSPWDLSTQNPNPNERMMFPRSYGGGDTSLENNFFHLSYMQALQQQQLGAMIPLNHHLTPQTWRAPYCPPPLHQPRPPTGQRLQPHEEPRPSTPTTVFFKSFDGVRPSVPSTTQGVPFQGYEASVSHQSQPPQPATSGGQPPCPTTTAPARPRVRARRGQATDPHSIAERQRRERIAERMKALQELVPTCNKTDKGAMLDEIIDYVKFLQLQVKVLSMSRIGGAEAVAPLVAEMSSEVSNGMSNRSTTVSSTDESMVLTEQQVARLMEQDTGAAMQYLQSKGMCLMPLSLAATLTSTSRSLQHHHHGHSMHAMMVRSPPNSNTNSDNNTGENNNTEEGTAAVSASTLTGNSVKPEDTIRHRGPGQ